MRNILILLALTMTACGGPCKVTQTRCHEGLLQVCGAGDQWQMSQDCGAVESADGARAGFVCQSVQQPEGKVINACLPPKENESTKEATDGANP